jgi:Ankyrin repeats (3 copies)
MRTSPNSPGPLRSRVCAPRFPRTVLFPALFPALILALIIAPRFAPAQSVEPGIASPNANLDARDVHGLTALVAAASSGDAAAVKSLLAQGAAVNAAAADGRTALIAAAQSGKLEIVAALIAAGANLNWSARGTGTALNVAENTGQAQMAALLLASGAQSTGKSVGDTVCVRPWSGDGFCGTVRSFSTHAVDIEITKIVGCTVGSCQARAECSAGKPIGGAGGAQAGDRIAVPSWCLTQTGLTPTGLAKTEVTQ